MTTRLIENFQGGTITDAPLGIGATTIHSAAFANLPVVATIKKMSLTLDPDGTAGAPEIVLVTAHVAASTAVTVQRSQETALNGGPARQHAAGTTWILAATAGDFVRVSGSPGDFKASIQTADHDEWLIMGQAVSNATTRYADLWAVAPAAWKSGTTLNLPSVDGRSIVFGGTIGQTAGAMTHTLTEANLPAHDHTINHDHAEVTTSSDGGHSHSAKFNPGAVGAGGTWFAERQADSGTTTTITNTEPDHDHTVELPAYVGDSGSVGSGTAVDHTPAHIRLNCFIHI